ncbi:MAG: hypothetical protein C5B49_13075, partial [Bdellovibrio sp.]
MRKWILLLSPLVLFLALLVVLRVFVQPQMETWALNEFQNFATNQLPFVIQADKFEFEWFSPKVRLHSARLRPHKKEAFRELTAKTIEAHFDLIQLVGGRIYLSQFLVDGAAVQMDLDLLSDSKEPAQEIPWDQFFSVLGQVPVSNFIIVDSEVSLSSAKQDLDLKVGALSGRVSNVTRKVSFDLAATRSTLRWQKISFPWSFRALGRLTPQSIEISELTVAGAGQKLQLAGHLSDPPKLSVHPLGQLKVKAQGHSGELGEVLTPQYGTPKLQGDYTVDGHLQLRGFDWPQGAFQLLTHEVFIGPYEVGSIKTQGDLSPGEVSLPKVELKHSAATVELSQVKLKIDQKPHLSVSIRSAVQTQELNLRQLLKQIDVGDLPLELFAGAEVDCGGPLVPKLSLVCTGDARLRHFEVSAERGEQNIVALDNAAVRGGVQITSEAVSYNANIRMGQDQGQSHGIISYEKGFNIHYETPSVDLAHIRKIHGMAVEGRAQISGSTSGDSRAATFNMSAAGQNLYLEDFFLGQANFKVNYGKGLLTFDNVEGRLTPVASAE